MKWYDDEQLYQPRVHSRWIRHLHRISTETGEPMTVLLDQALAEFVQQYPATPEVHDLLSAPNARRPVEILDEPPFADDEISVSAQGL